MEDSKHPLSIEQILKYCLGYIKLINPSFSRYKLYTDPLKPEYFNQNTIFDVTPLEEIRVPLTLNEFYKYTPKNIPKDLESIYLDEKALALKLEEIKNKQKVDEYTKQTYLNFGYFKVEIPESEEFLDDSSQTKPNGKKIKNDYYPLFSIPIEIYTNENKYYLYFLDNNIIPNLGFLQDVLGDDKYFEFADFVNQIEIAGELTFPLMQTTLSKIWENLKAKLKLSEAIFDENSFEITRYIVSLSSKTNYFLVQDLKKLSEVTNKDILDTSLSSWISDEELNLSSTVPDDGGDLFFPFDYDKYQLNVLSIIDNKASIVQGPPGTGKSQTIANLLCHLAANNKRVLFLSQKAQALKVVKDKLKSLNIEYLYGYIPNRYSNLYTEGEEKDGAAYSLAGIQQYINFIHDRKSLEQPDNDINIKGTKALLNESIVQQQSYYFLFNTIKKLSPYDINMPSQEKFSERFTEQSYKDFKTLENELTNLNNYCSDYTTSNNLASLDELYKDLDFINNDYDKDLKILIVSIEKSGYDRSSKIGRFINNSLLKIRLRNVIDKLPREIFEVFDSIINKDLSRAQMIKEINIHSEYFKYKKNTIKINLLNEQKELKIIEFGLDLKSLEKLNLIIDKEGLETSIKNIKLLIEAKRQLNSLRILNANDVNKQLHKIQENRKIRIKNYLQNRIKLQIINTSYTASIKGIIARIAKALQKSKRAYRTFDQLKKDPTNFQTLKEVIPIWIMDLEDSSRLIPLQKNLFDYIILDESSQCNLAYAMPAMYKSKHVMFFGDSEQMRDDSIKFKTNRSLEELARKFGIPNYMQIKSKGDAVQSVLDIGTSRGFQVKPLLYHYRSPKEVIGFSNDYFYSPKRKRLEVLNSNYCTYKNTNRVLINHIIKSDRKDDTSDKSNVAEVNYISRLVRDLKEDEKTKNKSIAILTFFNEQAYLLKQFIKDENIKISIIEGIQGDERDIVIYSFVIDDTEGKKRYIPLTSEQGEINKELNAGRVNVAFSRARQQVHCVTSLNPEEWPDGIWIKKYLEYVDKNGEINFFDQHLKKFDSFFEEEFYYFIRNKVDKKYIIQNQIESCGFKIDFVITDPKNGNKLAIECDGPTHFQDESSEVYIESDIDRQSILESAGWKFYRIAYSDWVNPDFDKKFYIKNIIDYLKNPSNIYITKSASSYRYEIVLQQIVKANVDNIDPTTNLLPKPTEITKKNVRQDFHELKRFNIDDYRDLVVSLFGDNQFIWINLYFKKGSYLGYGNQGIGIGANDLNNFIKESLNTIRTGQITSLPWKGDGKSKVIIQLVNGLTVDVRQFVETSEFTGFTKRGFRLSKEKYLDFIKELQK